MTHPVETSAVQTLLRRAKRRLRMQAALEGAATASVLASATALAAVYSVRVEAIAPITGIAILIAAGLVIVAGAIAAAARPLDDERVARRIDRASGLSDRLSTAIAFKAALKHSGPLDDFTRGMMVAAIRDAIVASPRADVRAATPFSRPRDLGVAAGFLVVCGLTAGLALPTADPRPGVAESIPNLAANQDANVPHAVALDPDEKAYIETIVAELKMVARRDGVPELEAFAADIEKLVALAEKGEIGKQELLARLAKAEASLRAELDPAPDEIAKRFGDIAKQLAKAPTAGELGDARKDPTAETVQRQLEHLAQKLAEKKLSAREKQQLSRQLARTAQQIARQDREQDSLAGQRQQKLQDEIRRLKEQKQAARTDREREEVERRLMDKQRELQKLEKHERDKQQSAQRRALKRLQKDLEQAAANLSKPDADPTAQEARDQQASENLRDAARQTGRVDRDQRKQAAQKKVASQMDDLREAMRRAKQKNNKGPMDPFNKNGKNRDFISRARGKKSTGQAWKPGQGQGERGLGQKSGQGQDNASPTWGDEHDEDLVGDPTAMSGNTKDEDLQGTTGQQGGSTRETILAAAQKGFAGVGYKKVYANYQRIVEEVMRSEKVPSSYKYYVKRYFAKIHPSVAASSGDTESANP